MICGILGVPFGELRKHLSKLSLDIFFSLTDSDQESLRLRNRAFVPFLFDEERCLDIDPVKHIEASHARIAKFCLDSLLVSTSKSNTIETDEANYHQQLSDLALHQQDPAPPTLQIACQYWFAQLPNPNNPSSLAILPPIESFLETNLLRWIQILVTCNHLDVAAPSLKRLEVWLNVSFAYYEIKI